MPEVGLDLTSGPCQRWELPETCGIGSIPRAVLPDPKPRMWTMSAPSFAAEMGPTGQAGMPRRVKWLVLQRPPALTCRKSGSRPLPRRTRELLMCSGLWTFHRFQPHPRASSQSFQPARYRELEQFDICSSSWPLRRLRHTLPLRSASPGGVRSYGAKTRGSGRLRITLHQRSGSMELHSSRYQHWESAKT